MGLQLGFGDQSILLKYRYSTLSFSLTQPVALQRERRETPSVSVIDVSSRVEMGFF